jgi:two-component system chemotaxis response regulator CheB
MELERSGILVAPNDHHLLVAGTRVVLSRGPPVNGHRPAVDPLFESAARAYGPRVLGILLSGTLDDGVAGLGAIKQEGGVTAVQDPDQAPYPGMPRAAIEADVADYVLSTGDLARLIASAGTGGVGPLRPVEGDDARVVVDDADGPAVLSALTCPNCGGALWEHQRNGVVQFECLWGTSTRLGRCSRSRGRLSTMRSGRRIGPCWSGPIWHGGWHADSDGRRSRNPPGGTTERPTRPRIAPRS